MGGTVPQDHLVQRIAQIGCSGRHASNCERDLQVIVKNLSLKARVESVRTHINSAKDGHVIEVDLPVIFPDAMAAALWSEGEDIFRHFFFNGVNARQYWRHCARHCDWFATHPANSVNVKKSHLVPLSLYGDGVQTFKNSECGVIDILAFTSDFAAGLGPMSRYLPILAISEHLVCSETWTDLWGAIVPRLCRMVSETDFPWSSAGYGFMLSSVQGDLKWVCEKFGLHNYRRNLFCSWCACAKSHIDVSMTLGDMRETAAHRSTLITHAQFLAGGSEASRILCVTHRFIDPFSLVWVLRVLIPEP